MTQRRGWIWLFAGVLMALIAGLLTFRTINEVSSNAALARLDNTPTLQVLVAAQNIPARQLLDPAMVKIQKVPAALAPEGYLVSTEDVLFKMSNTPIVAGEILLQQRLTDPTDPDAPVLYQLSANEVLISVPAFAILGKLGMLAVGDHIDIAYTVEFEFDINDQEESSKAKDVPANDYLPESAKSGGKRSLTQTDTWRRERCFARSRSHFAGRNATGCVGAQTFDRCRRPYGLLLASAGQRSIGAGDSCRL